MPDDLTSWNSEPRTGIPLPYGGEPCGDLDSDLIDEIGFLVWCYQEGYSKPEDRGRNWLGDDVLHAEAFVRWPSGNSDIVDVDLLTDAGEVPEGWPT